MNDRRIYVYKIIEDSGGAPCVTRALLTLALCKPSIRRSAAVGDWIFAFGSNNEDPANRLVYIASVTQKITDGQYYELARFTNRGDCIYQRMRDGRFVRRSGARFHNDADLRDYDVGESPDYRNAISLVSSDFRYYGDNSNDDWKIKAPGLTRVVEQMCQGHRINHSRQVREELIELRKRSWRKTQRVQGRPIHADLTCCRRIAEEDRSVRQARKC